MMRNILLSLTILAGATVASASYANAAPAAVSVPTATSTPAVQTVRTKKIPRNHVKAEATKEHPAQVEGFYEDVAQGFWSTIKFSGALPAQRVNELLSRVEKLQQAVKFAREEANGLEVEQQKVGERVLGYLFAK